MSATVAIGGCAIVNPVYCYTGGFSITAADADLATATRGIWVDGAGTLLVTMFDGSGPFTFTPAAKTYLPLAVKRVAAASTATGIVGLY